METLVNLINEKLNTKQVVKHYPRHKNFHIYLDNKLYKSFSDIVIRSNHIQTIKFYNASQGKNITLKDNRYSRNNNLQL